MIFIFFKYIIKTIWTVPATFVFVMTIGGLIGFLFTIDDHFLIEIGIILSVILLGFGISIEKKIPITLIIAFVGIGYFLIKTTLSSILLRTTRMVFTVYRCYLLIKLL